MVGDVNQFFGFRAIFRKHLAKADENELKEIRQRLELLGNDVSLREAYLKAIKPENIIQGLSEVEDASGL